MFDLKTIHLVLEELQETRGVSKDEVLDAISESLASAYKKQYGERGQIIRAKFNNETGEVDYFRVKEVVTSENIISEEDADEMTKEQYLEAKEKGKTRFIEPRHIMVENAKMIKHDVVEGDEIIFDLESKGDFGRVAAMAAKQTIRQKIKEAETGYIKKEFGDKEGEIVSGEVLRSEGGMIFVDLGKAEGVLPYAEQIKSEKYKTGDRIKAYLIKAGEGYRGAVELSLSRTHPEFLKHLFELEVPEIKEELVEIKRVVREPGQRSKIAVISHDENIDPVGTFVGQSGSRVMAVSSELSGEKIDIIEWSDYPEDFIASSLSPAEIIDIKITKEKTEKDRGEVSVYVPEDQFSLAIGRGGQNSRLAAKLTGYKIDIKLVGPDGEEIEREERKPKNAIVAEAAPEEKESVKEGKEEVSEVVPTEAPEENKEEIKEVAEEVKEDDNEEKKEEVSESK
jgi:N utilization substance protein A